MSRGNRIAGPLLVAIVAACVCHGVAEEQQNAGRASQRRFQSSISAADVRPHVEYLASAELQGRAGEGARRAAEYIRAHFEEYGLKPLFAGGSYFQSIPGLSDDDGATSIVGRNVGAWIEGRDPTLQDEVVIISAHYDHLGIRGGRIHPGADDNASGVAMLLEAARQFSTRVARPRRSVAFVGFDLEERMLWGSRWFAAHPPWPLQRVKLFMTADMIGRSLGDLPLSAVFVLGSEHAPRLKSVLNDVGAPAGMEVCRLGIDLVGTRSDYGPFRDRKIPFLFFSTGEHADYHSPRDVPQRVDYEKVAAVSGLMLRVCREVADTDRAPKWTDTVSGDLDEARTLNCVATLLLDTDREVPMSDLQRLLVTHAEHKTRQILERGEMTEGERRWLAHIAQLMLLSVF